MSTLLYRGHTYEHQPAAQKVCKQLSYRGQEYNTCTEHQPADLHPHLSYRGIGYDKSIEAEEECRLSLRSPVLLFFGPEDRKSAVPIRR